MIYELTAEQMNELLLDAGHEPENAKVQVEAHFWPGVLEGAPMPTGWTLDPQPWAVPAP